MAKVQQRLNRDLALAGYLLTKRGGLTIHRELEELLRNRFPRAGIHHGNSLAGAL